MAIKSIRFRGKITSNGIVNFDGEKAKWHLIKDSRYSFDPKFKNYKIAKHSITQSGVSEKGRPIFHAVLKISKNCIRQAIFKDDQPFHNPHIYHAENILIKLLSSAAGLLRGYLFADLGIKKKSPIFISDAVQISNNVSTIDVGTTNGPKDKKADTDDDGGLSLYYKESIGGEVIYEFQGALDLDELQFISLSQIYDRLAVNPNYLGPYMKNLETTLGSKPGNKAFFIKKTAVNGLPEEGILLNSDQVKVLIKEFFQRFLNMEIYRGASGHAWLSELEIMPKSNGLNNTNWIPVKTSEDVLNPIDSVHCFYDEYDQEEAVNLYKYIDIEKQKQNDQKKAKKAKSKEEKESTNQKKESTNQEK